MGPRIKLAAEPPPNRQLTVEYVHRDALKFNPHNPNRHSRSKILKLAASVKALGMNVPVLVEADLTILSGEARVKACKEIGVGMVPIIRLEHLTPEQARVFMVAENRFAELSQMDFQALGRLFKDLSVLDLDFSLEASGFKTGEIDLMVEALDLSIGDPEDDPITMAPGPAVSRLGDAWLLHNPRSGLKHKIVCGDALTQAAYAQLLGDQRAAAVITDPPFGKPIQAT